LKDIRQIDLDNLESILQKLKDTKMPFMEQMQDNLIAIRYFNKDRKNNLADVVIIEFDHRIFAELNLSGCELITTRYCKQFDEAKALVEKTLGIKVKKIVLCDDCEHKLKCNYKTPRCNDLGFCDVITMM